MTLLGNVNFKLGTSPFGAVAEWSSPFHRGG